jgi:tetratricopeptide (TPR) repeat protein
VDPTSSSRRPLGWVVVLLVALGVRLLAHPQLEAAADTFAPIIDGEAYLLQALRVAAGEDIADGVYFQAPLYPWVLGLTFRLAGVPGVPAAAGIARAEELSEEVLLPALAVGRNLNLLLGLLAVLLIERLGSRLYGAGAGLAAGLTAAVYGPFLFYEGLLLKASLSLIFLPWAVLAGARALRHDAAGSWAWVGLALGLGGLVRGNLHAVGAAAALGLLAFGFRTRRPAHGLRCAGALALGVACALAPVVIRNSLVAGRPVLSTAAGGTAFYLCNHPDNDTGLIQHRAENRQVPRHELQDWTAEAEARTGRRLDAGEVNRFWMAAAWEGIRERPATWALAELRKAGLLFSRYEAPDNALPAIGEEVSAVLALTPSRYAVVLPLACGGILLVLRRRRREAPEPGRALHGLLLAAYAATLLLFIVTSRFRLPLAPLLIVYAGYLLARLGTLSSPSTSGRERALVGGAVLLGGALSLASEGPLGPLDRKELASHEVVCLKNRAQVAAARGDLAAARDDLEQASLRGRAAGIDAPALHVEAARLDRLEALGLAERADPGDRERARGLLARADQALQRALELDREHAAAWRELGLLAYQDQRDADAVEALVRSRALQPRDRETHQYLALSLLALDRAAEALDSARWLTGHDGQADDGWGLLALALTRLGRADEARPAVERYDELASMRESGGQPRRFPDQDAFQPLRSTP